MKKCVNCKKELEDEVVFCTFCGANQPNVGDMGGATMAPKKRILMALIGGILGFVTMIVAEIASYQLLNNSGLLDWYLDFAMNATGGEIDLSALEGLMQYLGAIVSISLITTPALVTGILGLVFYFSGKTGKGAFVLGIITSIFAGIATAVAFANNTTAGTFALICLATAVGATVTIALARKASQA